MLGIGGTDELIIAGIHQIPDVLNFTGYLIYVLLGGYAALFCIDLNLLTVFIGTGHKEYIIALQTAITGNGVCQDDFIGIADSGYDRGREDRCGGGPYSEAV